MRLFTRHTVFRVHVRQRNYIFVAVKLEKIAKPATAVQDYVSTFVNVKLLDNFQLILWKQKQVF